MLLPGMGELMVRLGEIVVILDLHRQGAGISAIARRMGMDRKTVRKVIESGLEPPAYGPARARSRNSSGLSGTCTSGSARSLN